MSELPAVLALDGGNSKTDVALVAADGSVLATARGPGMPTADLDGSLRVISDLIGLIARQAGQPGRPAVRHICACVANADLPEEEEQLARAIQAGGWSETTEVVNDTFAVLRAGLAAGTPVPSAGGGAPGTDGRAPAADGRAPAADGGAPAADGGAPAADGGAPAAASDGHQPDQPGRHWGVGVTCGAGINCVGVAPDGQTTRYLALGMISGDWGGGYGIGRAALWWAMRAEDGRGPDTALREAVPAHFDLPAVHDVSVGIHQGKIGRDDVGRLAPAVLAAAAAGDQVAGHLVRRQAEEIVVMALVAMRRLGLTGLATPVVLGGGLLTARDPLLTSAIVTGIGTEAPRATVRIVDVPPIAGAVLLGLDKTGAPPDAEQRLRAAYTQPRSPAPG